MTPTKDRLAAVEAERDALRAALEWYADGTNYQAFGMTRECGCCTDTFTPALSDQGFLASQAMKGQTK